MLKQNSSIKSFRLSEGKTQIKTLGLILIVALFFIGFVLLVGIKVNNDINKNNQAEINKKSSEPKLPDSLTAPLHNKNKIDQVVMGEEGDNTVVFYSDSSIEGIIEFYQDWSEDNGYVWINKEEITEKGKKYYFVLNPSIGKSSLPEYYFTVETKENKTRVIVSYKEADQRQSIQPVREIEIPKDFKLKF